MKFTLLSILKCECIGICNIVHSQYRASITSNSRRFSSPEKEPVPISSHSVLPRALVTTDLFSVSVDLPVLGISDKWNHTLCGLFCLAALT